MHKWIVVLGVAISAVLVPALSFAQNEGDVQAVKARREQARTYFNEGYQLYTAGEYLKAVKKLKQAYKLYPTPIILFYIAETYRAAELYDEAIRYYRLFLQNALPSDPRRKEAEKWISELSKGKTIEEEAAPSPAPARPVQQPAPAPKEEKAKPKKKRRAVKPGELIHTPLEEAQPGRPAKIEAELPEDIKRAWLYFYYRYPKDKQYTRIKMRVDANDVYYVVLPCEAMKEGMLYYYIEAIGVNGKSVAHAGTATSPLIIDINADNPLQPGGRMSCEEARGEAPEEMRGMAGGVGTTKKAAPKRKPAKFYFAVGASVLSGALFAASAIMGSLAMSKAAELHDAQQDLSGSNVRVRRVFSSSLQDVETMGIAYERTAILTGVLGVLTAGAAAYLWGDYLGYIPKRYSLFKEEKVTAAPTKKEQKGEEDATMSIYPLMGTDMVGVGAVVVY